jgi:hypothetical protein
LRAPGGNPVLFIFYSLGITSAGNCTCITKSMSIWLILFLVQVMASVYAVARQPKQDRRWGTYAVRETGK